MFREEYFDLGAQVTQKSYSRVQILVATIVDASKYLFNPRHRSARLHGWEEGSLSASVNGLIVGLLLLGFSGFQVHLHSGFTGSGVIMT